MGSVASHTASIGINAATRAARQPGSASSALLQRPLHDDGRIKTGDLDADLGRRRWIGSRAGLRDDVDGQKDQWRLSQRGRHGIAFIDMPPVHDVGVESMQASEPCHRRA